MTRFDADDVSAASATLLMRAAPVYGLAAVSIYGLSCLGAFMAFNPGCLDEGAETSWLLLAHAALLPVLAVVSWRERNKGRWRDALALLLDPLGWFALVLPNFRRHLT